MYYLYMTPGLKKVSQGTLKMLNLIYPYNLNPVSAYPSRLLMTLMNQRYQYFGSHLSVSWRCHCWTSGTTEDLELHLEISITMVAGSGGGSIFR